MNCLYVIVTLTVLGLATSAFAEDCLSGTEGNLCRADKGDRRAMYMVARAAYVKENNAITNGAVLVDFSEAYEWAWKSQELGFRGGHSVLKMIYLNATSHKDPVQAHRWLTRAINEGQDYVVIWRARLEATMAKEQIDEANSLPLELNRRKQ